MTPQLTVATHLDSVDLLLNGRAILRHTPQRPLVAIGWGTPSVTMHHGNFRIRPGLQRRVALQRCIVEQASADAPGDGTTVTLRFPVPGTDTSMVLTAAVAGGATPHAHAATDTTPKAAVVRFDLAPDPAHDGPGHDRLWIAFAALESGEPVHGGGEQYSRFDLRGSRLPIWVREQGVGRGHDFVTLAANMHSEAGGAWHTTYFPQPSWVTPTGRVVHLDSTAYALIDASRRESETVEVWQPRLSGIVALADGLAGGVSLLSDHLGRQPNLPDWADTGFVVGLQGGRDVVRAKVDRAREAGIALAGVWAQDWEGRRVTTFGSQLFWDWRYSEAMYPGLPEFIRELGSEGVRFMGYINPFLAIEGELYREAGPAGYCVKTAAGEDYLITVTTFPAALVDLTNPEAAAWLKGVIRRNMIGIGLSGWMADFGEYLPTDAVLHEGSAADYHNRYPADWAQLNREAIDEAGAGGEVAIFMRAGYTGSSRHTNLIWAGDQMVDWSRHDGLPSVIPAALSAGVSGIGMHSSDVGGYTTLFGRKRTKELFMRWAEASVWTPFFRSHEGNRPKDNWQWDGDGETMSHLAAMTRAFVALRPYRRAVIAEYLTTGLPVQRPVAMEFPRAAVGRPSDYRWMVGRDLLVAPVLRPGQNSVEVALPAGEWTHLWSGARFVGGRRAARVAAPLGRPPVFVREGSRWTETFAAVAAAIEPAVGKG